MVFQFHILICSQNNSLGNFRGFSGYHFVHGIVFGNKTTIGQVCSFAKGLASNTVTNIPGFCCLDAPYQSKIEEWGEKVSSWDVRMKKEDCYCDISAKLTT